MNIDAFEVDFVWDISMPNSVYNFDSMPHKESLGVAAFSVFHSRVKFDRQEKIDFISFFIDHLLSGLEKCNLWFYVSNRCWQPDTKLIRHKGFMRRSNLQNNKGREFIINERIFESNDEIKFLVEMNVGTITSSSIAALVLDEINNYLVVFQDDDNHGGMLVRPIEDSFLNDFNFFNEVFEKNGVVLKRVGTFDDPEIGFVGFGNPDLCCRIAKKLGFNM